MGPFSTNIFEKIVYILDKKSIQDFLCVCVGGGGGGGCNQEGEGVGNNVKLQTRAITEFIYTTYSFLTTYISKQKNH